MDIMDNVISIKRGETGWIDIQPEFNGTAIANFTGLMSVKKTIDDTYYVLQKLIEGGRVYFFESDTDALSYGDYVYDVQICIDDEQYATMGPYVLHILQRDDKSLMDSYVALITSEHRDKPKYMAMIRALLAHSEEIFAAGVYFDEQFDLDLATGKQEDMLGNTAGVSRTLDFQPDKGLSPVLDNYAYRNLLRAKIAKNFWKGGIDELHERWKTLFGKGILVQDNLDMTIDVVVIGDFDQITKDMIKRGYIIPKPQSVGVHFSFADNAVFGYDLETDQIKGYDEADWVNPLLKDSFGYDLEDSKVGILGYDEADWT